ncbi:MAG: hypothetical protein ACRD4B_00845 [Acidobacteriota bacterium]
MKKGNKQETPINQGTKDETLAGKDARGEAIAKQQDELAPATPNLTPGTATPEERRGFRCGECKAEFTSDDDLQRHEDHMHSAILADTKSGHSGQV